MREKRVLNFRLNEHTVNTISLLQKKLGMTKTSVIENALREYADHKLATADELLAFAGTLKGEDAKSMLKHIRKNRRNKNKDLSL